MKPCRYYNGTDKVYKDPIIQTYAHIEEMWVNKMIADDEMLPSCYAEYVRFGLTHFCENDGVDVSLKALICNRFMHYNERTDIEAFKAYYKAYCSYHPRCYT